jgi:hypothetical protein
MAPRVSELEARRLLAVSTQPTPADIAFVTNLYETALFREPTADDVAHWSASLARGASERAITRIVLHSQERAGLVSALGVNLNGTPQQFVDSLYTGLLDRAPDAAGEAFWLQAVRKGTDRETIVQEFLEAGDFPGVATSALLGASPTETIQGDAVTLTAVVSPKAGSLPATGSVEFFDGAALVATAPVSGFQAVATTTALPPGTDAITAVYLGDSHYQTSTSQVVAVQVLRSSTTTLDASPASPTFGAPVTLTATVTGAGAAPTGTVEFYDGATDLGPGTLSSGTATLMTSTLAPGSHTLKAAYPGNSIYAASTSTPAHVTVARAGTTTSLKASPTSATPGNPVLLTATVSSAGGPTLPGGTVEFFNGTTDLGPGTLAGGKATLTTSSLPIGTNQLTAAYAGDANFKTSTSPAVAVAIGQATTTTLVAAPTTATYGTTVELTATVTATGGGLVRGTVEFYDGTTDLGPADVDHGAAVFDTNQSTGGVHSFTAVYSGDGTNLPSTSAPASVTIDQAAPQLSLSADHTDVADGAPVTFTLYVLSTVGTGIPSGSVTFYDGKTPLGTQTLPGVPGQVAKLTTSSLSHGTHTITASYAGDINFGPGTSAPVTVNVGVIGTTTSLTSELPLAFYGDNVTLTATVTPDSGTGTPTGTVEFYAGTTNFGSASLGDLNPPNEARLTTSTIPTGTTSVTAVYEGDNQYGTSTSPATSQIIAKAPIIMVGKASPTSITSGSPVTITAQLFVVGGSPTGATGTITFYEGSTVLGALPPTNGEAKLTTSSLIAPGPHVITIDYSGDANYTESTTLPLTIYVGQATTTALKVVPTSSTFGDSVALTATIAPASGSGTPTGTVTFESVVGPLDEAVPVTNGVASDTVQDLPGGDSTITAVYSGDSTYAGSTSPGVPVSVARVAPTMTFTSSATSSPFGSGVALTANISVPEFAAYPPGGSVEFFAGTTSLGSASPDEGASGTEAVLLARNIPLGNNILLTAVYSGDGNYLPITSAPVPITITPAPTVTSLSASPTLANPGDLVTLTAAVSSVGVTATPPGSADFYDGSTKIGSAPISPSTGEAVFTTTTLASGPHSLTASYPGSTAFLPSPASNAVTVNIS